MLFLSGRFFLFWPVTALGYHLVPRRWKAGWLLAASWFFYLCAGAAYFPVLLFVVLSSYTAGRLLERRPRRGLLALAVLLPAGLLFVLKYLTFALELAAAGLAALGLTVSSPALKLLLPAGLSFYVFQAVGYVIDVYRGDQRAQRSFLRHALFLSFFPQLLSGPDRKSVV